MAPADASDVPPAPVRFASGPPGQAGPSRSGNLSRPIVLDREAQPSSTFSPPARAADRAPAQGATAGEAVLDLGEPIDLAELEIEETASAEEVRVKPEPAVSATVLVDDGGEALLRDALSRASREVIERIAWEVIPTLAETIIREHVERLVNQREK